MLLQWAACLRPRLDSLRLGFHYILPSYILLHITFIYLTISYYISPSSSPRAERARAVTVSQCPHSEVGQDFLLRRRVTLTEINVTRKRKNGKIRKFWAKKKDSLLYSNHVPATTGQCCPKEKVPFYQIINGE